MIRLLSIIVVLCLAGCEVEHGTRRQQQNCPNGQCPTRPVVDIPAASVPYVLRTMNYLGGSCVHASTITDFSYAGEVEWAAFWRRHYSGGETYSGLTGKLRANKIPFYATHDGDRAVLDRCTRERRPATIFYFTNHSINFNGFHGGYAYLLDNNATKSYIKVPEQEFLARWRGWGGVAVVPTIGAPPAPYPWI